MLKEATTKKHIISNFVQSGLFTTTYCKKWISDSVVTEIVNKSELLEETSTKGSLNQCMSKEFSEIHNISNCHIVTRKSHQENGKRIYGYYFKKEKGNK